MVMHWRSIKICRDTDCGEIHVGVTNNGDIVGVEDTKKEMERISNMIHDGITQI